MVTKTQNVSNFIRHFYSKYFVLVDLEGLTIVATQPIIDMCPILINLHKWRPLLSH